MLHHLYVGQCNETPNSATRADTQGNEVMVQIIVICPQAARSIACCSSVLSIVTSP